MSILINNATKVVVQGITGREGGFHARQMVDYGTQVVAGVAPGKGGSWVLDDKVPVFESMQAAVEATEANTSVVFVPARQASDALFEAADSGVELVVCITEGIPIHDIIKVERYMETRGVRLVGPNSPGIINPGELKVGVIPDDCVVPGKVGIVSRSGSLSYVAMRALKNEGIGVSTFVGIGGDIIQCTSFTEILEMFENDPYTDSILIIGECGGLEEERAAHVIVSQMTKPIVALIAGECAIPGKRMGHSGAFIEAGIGTTVKKKQAFSNIGVKVASNIQETVDIFKSLSKPPTTI